MIISDQVLKEEYLNKHLPYRINSMLAHDLIMHRKTTSHFYSIRDSCYGDSTVVEPIFEISIIFGRTLLNFLGLTYDKENNKIKTIQPKNDDLTIQSLFPNKNLCTPEDPIVKENHDELCTIIKLANKSVAHLTSEISETKTGDHDKLPKARIAIYNLMLKYVPEMNKDNIWWTTQMT